MRTSAWIAIVGLAGCDKLFSLPHITYVPDGPPIDAPACPSTYVPLAGASPPGSKYRYVSRSELWSNAAADCANDLDGATHLVVFSDVNEVVAVRTLVTDQTIYALFTGYARDTVAAGGDPAIFFAVTGEKVESGDPSYELWADNEPNNFNGVETITFITHDANLLDGEPSRMQDYICECDGRPVTRTFVLQ